MSDDFPWPLGPVLEKARIERGLATREAARRAGFSDTLWRTLERGYELRKGTKFPASPRANTVAAAAKVVGIPVDSALSLAGLSVRDLGPEPDAPDLSGISDDQLLEEVRRRMGATGERKGPSRADVAQEPGEWTVGEPEGRARRKRR